MRETRLLLALCHCRLHLGLQLLEHLLLPCTLPGMRCPQLALALLLNSPAHLIHWQQSPAQVWGLTPTLKL